MIFRILLLFILCSGTCIAQETTTRPNLKDVYTLPDDTSKVIQLLSLCIEYYNIDHDTSIKIEINSSTDHLLLRVLDNGIGFDNNKAGLGLNNVKYRSLLYNGNTIITSKKGKGTEILIDMNYKKS